MISEKQDRFINALLVSPSMKQACETAGISRTTGYDYLNIPGVADEYQSRKERRNDVLLDCLKAQSYKALECLAGVLEDEKASTAERIKAAQILLTQSAKSFEIEKDNRKSDLNSAFDFGL